MGSLILKYPKPVPLPSALPHQKYFLIDVLVIMSSLFFKRSEGSYCLHDVLTYTEKYDWVVRVMFVVISTALAALAV